MIQVSMLPTKRATTTISKLVTRDKTFCNIVNFKATQTSSIILITNKNIKPLKYILAVANKAENVYNLIQRKI